MTTRREFLAISAGAVAIAAGLPRLTVPDAVAQLEARLARGELVSGETFTLHRTLTLPVGARMINCALRCPHNNPICVDARVLEYGRGGFFVGNVITTNAALGWLQ